MKTLPREFMKYIYSTGQHYITCSVILRFVIRVRKYISTQAFYWTYSLLNITQYYWEKMLCKQRKCDNKSFYCIFSGGSYWEMKGINCFENLRKWIKLFVMNSHNIMYKILNTCNLTFVCFFVLFVCFFHMAIHCLRFPGRGRKWRISEALFFSKIM